MKNKKIILPIAFGVALVGTLIYFLSKSIPSSTPTPPPTPTPTPKDNSGEGSYGTDTMPSDDHTQFLVKTRSGSRLRSEPSTSSTIIKTYDAGVIMAVINPTPLMQSDGEWYKVKDLATSQMGYMRSDVVDDPVLDGNI